jgi:hypothetical protein
MILEVFSVARNGGKKGPWLQTKIPKKNTGIAS